MKKFSFSLLLAIMYCSAFSQSYPVWDAISYNYSVNIFNDMVTETGKLHTTKNDATLTVSSGVFSGDFSATNDTVIQISANPDVNLDNYFQVNFQEFLNTSFNLSGLDVSGTMFDLSSGNTTIKAVFKSNVPIVVQAQLIDVNGHVTCSSTSIYDTVTVGGINDTCIFKDFIMEDWYSTTWWNINNGRGVNGAFPQDAIIPVEASKIVAVRFSIVYYTTVPNDINQTPIALTVKNLQISGNAPILQLPSQELITPYYQTKDTLHISDFVFDANTDIENLTWSFESTDPNVVVEYDDVLKIIVISNLSKPVTVNLTATNDLGLSTTESYIVFYINDILHVEKSSSIIYNSTNQTIEYTGADSPIISIFDIQGKCVLSQKSSLLDVSNLRDGMYIVKCGEINKVIKK